MQAMRPSYDNERTPDPFRGRCSAELNPFHPTHLIRSLLQLGHRGSRFFDESRPQPNFARLVPVARLL